MGTAREGRTQANITAGRQHGHCSRGWNIEQYHSKQWARSLHRMEGHRPILQQVIIIASYVCWDEANIQARRYWLFVTDYRDSNFCRKGVLSIWSVRMHLIPGMGRYWTTETNMTFDIRCTYSFSVIVGAPGFNSSDRVLEIDSMVLAPDITTSLVYQQAG